MPAGRGWLRPSLDTIVGFVVVSHCLRGASTLSSVWAVSEAHRPVHTEVAAVGPVFAALAFPWLCCISLAGLLHWPCHGTAAALALPWL